MYDCEELNERKAWGMFLQNPWALESFVEFHISHSFLSSNVCLTVWILSQSCLVVPGF